MSNITINGVSLDPIAETDGMVRANLVSADSSKSDALLIQVQHPLDAGERAALTATGAEILEYVDHNTYLCHYPPTDLQPVRTLPFVVWANTYLEGFKISAALRFGAESGKIIRLLEAAPLDQSSKESVPVVVVLHRYARGEAVRDKIAAAAGESPDQLRVSPHKIRLTVERGRLPALTAIDEIHHVEPYLEPRLFNNIARGILRATDAQTGGAHQGDGQVVAVADTGFDMGKTDDTHPAFTGRVAKLYALGRTNDASDPNGHGTHVSGSVLGDGVMADGTVVQGTAPKARLILQSIGGPPFADPKSGEKQAQNLTGLPNDLHDLFTPPYRDDGARVHSNSWGSPAAGAYDASANEVDDFIWNNRDCAICFAAGNDGVDSKSAGVIDNGSIGSPGVAKNCITVGASENLRPTFVDANNVALYGTWFPTAFPADPIKSDKVADNADGMVAFSSRGPTITGRVKPDVVAPGSAILSTRSRATQGTGWAPSSDPLFMFDGGTSMATPLVAGTAAVVRDYLIAQNVAKPSAALVKAMLINGAKIMAGQYTPPEVAAPPDNSQGFGRVDLATAIGPYASGETVVFKDENTALDTNQDEHTTQAVTAGQSLKVTLVWTDQAGEKLQNDLDLIVKTPDGTEQHGNMPAGSADFDRLNNVEQVVLTGLTAGNVDIIVRGHAITAAQSYALVIRATGGSGSSSSSDSSSSSGSGGSSSSSSSGTSSSSDSSSSDSSSSGSSDSSSSTPSSSDSSSSDSSSSSSSDSSSSTPSSSDSSSSDSSSSTPSSSDSSSSDSSSSDSSSSDSSSSDSSSSDSSSRDSSAGGAATSASIVKR